MTDGQGYFAYLPAVFIYHDLQFDFVEGINETYYQTDKRANYVVAGEQGNVNKYFVGTALVQTPFFLSACVLSKALSQPVDGYSWPFQLMVGLAAITCLAIGLLFLGKLLVKMGFSERIAVASLCLILFGTNLLYYTIYEPSMSHVYSFMAVSAFLYFGREAVFNQTNKTVFFAAISLGVIVLIRPVNGLILLALPAVSGGFQNTILGVESLFRKQWKVLLGAMVLGVGIMAIQPLIYILQTGKPFVWSYQEEGFNFFAPEVINVLFSYRKGLFTYCPVLLLAAVSIFLGFIKRKEGFGGLLLVLALVTWVISSWWMWYYGGSYGHRAFIEFYPLFAIGLALALQSGIGIIPSKAVLWLGVLLVGVQLIQTYQYNRNIIPFDNMTKEKYWNLFLRTGDDLAWYYSGYEGQDSYQGKDSTLIFNDMESSLGWGNEQQLTDEKPYEGSRSAHMTSADQYGPTLRFPGSEVRGNVIRISGWVWSDSRITDFAFVCALEDSTGASYVWQKRPLRPQFSGTGNWSWVTALFRTGYPRDAKGNLVIYPMKSDGADVYIDNLEISIITTD